MIIHRWNRVYLNNNLMSKYCDCFKTYLKEEIQSSVTRRMGIKFLSGLIHLCTGKRVYDVTCGFRAVNRTFIGFYAEEYPDDYPEPQAIVAGVMHRGNIQEIPAIMHERENGVRRRENNDIKYVTN